MKRLLLFLAPWLVFVLLIVAVVIAMGTRAHGQFGAEQPMFAMQSTATTLPEMPTPYLQWIWTNMVTNAFADTWADRISGTLMSWPQNARTKPFSYSTGTWWGVSTSMTNLPAPHNDTNWAYGYILRLDIAPASQAQLGCYASYAGVLGFSVDASKQLNFSHGAPVVWSTPLALTKWYDILFTCTPNVGGGSSTLTLWTNGIISDATTSYTPSADPIHVTAFGNPNFNNQGLAGFVKQVLVWTNGIGTNGAEAFHRYHTNLYTDHVP